MSKHHFGISRRDLIGGLGAGGLLLAAPNYLRAAEKSDVIVLGAGLAGLNAALKLEQLGFKVKVLEASDHVGGRVQTRNFAGIQHELGASDIGVMYARVMDMMQQLKLELVPSSINIRPFSYNLGGTMLRADEWEASNLNKTVGDERAVPPSALERHVLKQINPFTQLDDWLQPDNQTLDIPLASYMRSEGVSDAAIRLIEHTYNGNGMSRTSALATLRDATRSKFGIEAFLAKQQAGMDVSPLSQVKGGNQRLPDAMAAALKSDVHVDKAAAVVDQNASGVEVTCMDGSRYQADFLVSAMPLTALKAVNFAPALSPAKAAAAAQIGYYQTTKFYLQPTQTFWDDDGFEPTMWTDSPIERVFAAQDDNQNVHTLLVWINGQGGQRIDKLGEAGGKRLVLDTLARLRPASKGKLDVVGYHSWGNTPYIGGCGASYSAGQIQNFGKTILAPEGRIHFAGEHTRQFEPGMESAMASGERVSIEIVGAAGG
jgi:monoamine oxidase